ncbi:CidA/LrgA family protein [Bacillus sp. FJAT-42315]|uniref:CidA/LrgA family protein n=1 Tax=Bacillus sp. FJAT-42315 TaxID=2014077 RepID=UPI000C25141B|nr:CidA/LrgA family protein [Bacillus sp. FJAT-42315]
MRDGVVFIFQIALLWLINEVSDYITDFLNVPIPGNVFGMIMLFFLLVTGVIRMDWVERGASFLNKHLSFFFVPIAVGLMMYGGLIKASGWMLAVVIFGSSAIGLVITGGVTQALSATSKRKESGHEQHHII